MKKLFELYKQYRYRLVFGLFVALIIGKLSAIFFSDHISDPTPIILSIVPILLLLLLNDWRIEINDRLKVIDREVNDLNPPTYGDFPEMRPDLKQVILNCIGQGTDVNIKVIGVSAKYTLPYFTEILRENYSKLRKNQKFEIGFTIATERKLTEWELTEWSIAKAESQRKFSHFIKSHSTIANDPRIDLNLYEYDNIPHWHGVLINEEILFMGRTSWIKYGDDKMWKLKVGEVEYRYFENDDVFGGSLRVRRYINWFNRYADWAKKNNHHTSNKIEASQSE